MKTVRNHRLPQPAEDAHEKELEALVPIEILVLMPDGQNLQLALQGRKTLGWFGVNAQGYGVIQGYVPQGETLQLISRSDDLKGTGLSVLEIQFDAPAKDPNGAVAILDLSSGRASEYVDGPGFRVFNGCSLF